MPEGSYIQIIVNGENRTIATGATVIALLESLSLNPGAVVVQRNEHILSRESHASTRLENGDVLEIVRFVGGG